MSLSSSVDIKGYFHVKATTNINLLQARQHWFWLFTRVPFTLTAFSHQDGNGYIDEQELDALLKDLCDKKKMVIDSDLSVFLNIIILLLKENNVCLSHEDKVFSRCSRLIVTDTNTESSSQCVRVSFSPPSVCLRPGQTEDCVLTCLSLLPVSVAAEGGPGRAGELQGQHHGPVRRRQAVPHRAGDCPLQGFHAVSSEPGCYKTLPPPSHTTPTPTNTKCMHLILNHLKCKWMCYSEHMHTY